MKPVLNIQSFIRKLTDLNLKTRMHHLVWPCNLYSVAVKKEQDRVNIFEKAILRLIGKGVESHESIAEYLCLDTDLVRFLLMRLKQKGLTSPDGRLTNAGKIFLQTTAVGVNTTAFIYQERTQGKLLPFASETKLQFLLPDPEGESYYLGEIGDKKNRLYNPWRIAPDKQNFPVPTPLEVKKTLETFMKLHRKTPPLYDRDVEMPSFMLNTASICVQPQPQPIYLHCICTLSPNSRDVLVLNPFAYEGDLTDLSELLKQRPDDYDIAKKSLLKDSPSPKEVSAAPEKNFADARYPEILKGLNRASEAFSALDADHIGKDLDWTEGKRRELVTALHACLENLLRRMLSETDKNCFATLLCNGDTIQNGKILNLAAERLNLEYKHAGEFLCVSSDEIRACLNGKITLRPLFALALASADADERHPLRNLAKEIPDMIERMIRLKTLRDKANHGEALSQHTSMSELSGLRDLVFHLCKFFCQELEVAPSRQDTLGNSDMNMEAVEKALLVFFPQKIRSRFPEGLDRELRMAESTLQQYGIGCGQTATEIPVESIVNLYGFCQRVFSAKGTGTSIGIDEAAYTENACLRARQSGLLPSDSQLPEELSRTATNNISKAMQGGKTTLGGACLAYLLNATNEELELIASHRQTLLSDVAALIRLRGHGQGMISTSEAENLREAVYKDCCALLGD